MSNIPHPAPSVNPLSCYYDAGLRWADCKKTGLTVLPGSITKSPLVSTKKHIMATNRSTCVGVSEEDAKDHRFLVKSGYPDVESYRVLPVQPLLFLDSPNTTMLCVLDVDNMEVWDDVVDFLRGHFGVSLNNAVVVSSGREGGGRHIYFRRDPVDATKYKKSNRDVCFGGRVVPNTATPGWMRVSNNVDLLGLGAHVVCPGAVHKSGLVYKASLFDGREFDTLSDVLNQMPVMPLSLWSKMLDGPKGRDLLVAAGYHSTGEPIVEGVAPQLASGAYGSCDDKHYSDLEGPDADKWAPILRELEDRPRNVKLRIVCPWCLAEGEGAAHRGVANFEIYPGNNSGTCYNQNRKHYVPGIKVRTPIEIEAVVSECVASTEVACPLPPNNLGESSSPLDGIIQEVKVDPIREVRLNFDKRIEKGAEAEAKKNFFYHMLEGYEGFECDPDDRRPIEEQVARAIHEAQDRVWEIRCRRSPEIAVTYNKCGVGHAIFSTLTCWQASCRECRPFVLGSAASAIEVHLLAAFRSGSIISMYTMPLELHNRSSTKVLLSQWASSNDDPTINSGLLNNRETRVNSELPENDWIGVKNHREVVYFFCRNPDAGGNKKLVPAVIAKNGTPYRWGQITKESDILRVVSEVMAELQTQGDIANSAEEEIREMKRKGAESEDIRAKEAAAPENLSGDLLFGPRVTISKLNTLRRAITGRGSSVVPKGQRAATKAEKARQKEVEGVEDYQVNVGYGIRKGVMKQISEDLVTTVTPENPTAGGLFPKNTKDRLHMNVPMTETVNKAAANGKYKKAEPGHRIGNNGRDEEEKIEIGTHAHGLTIVSVTEPVKELDDQLLDMGI